ncbi:conserved hypothetical protein [Leishmania infantum JPCM5]|uniref:Uncharacterized protein n=2 Tax=Leishmania infantum TaxID=5671 RepID=A4I4G1_LEIIN|nr:conserved hypothetical protein [Leishmania infantum JPCM5]CAC9508093.1 hypothetical_protein_-_conserved [Leishmania infantum]CAM69670.1 conserved hypothetical protein [Leishmania infantum JPCM5]SUZ43610.1 hypothetical_protein_-_conserved [Leishmania infantum]|eukprot:XP_001466630.1 conserved hypothetical protein [Leishmania infantum JPCM5]
MLLSTTLMCFRPRGTRGAGFCSLRRRLRRLRQTNRAAMEQLQERRRLQHLLREEQRSASATSSSSGGASAPGVAAAQLRALELLPRNDALEAAIALCISENRDARTDLELVRHLVNSTLLSFASPVCRRWDPYDVKPQVFALDNYIALPVFTSLEYLRLFCQRFGFAVRDPSGVLWASGSSTTASAGGQAPIMGLLPDTLLQSEWWQQRHAQQEARPPTEVTMQERDDAPDGLASQGGQPAQEREAKAVPEDGTEAHMPGSACVALKAAELTVPNFAPGSDAAQAAPPTPLDGTPINADALFDTMLMDGLVEKELDTSSAPSERRRVAPAKKAVRTRARKRSHGSASKVRGIRRRVASSSHHRVLRERHTGRRQRTAGAATAAASREESVAGAASAKAAADEAKAAYWESVSQTSPFQLKQATPLPMFGPFLHPFLIGYFADVSTLLHNASIVPEKVDIVLNPASPLEFVLSRAATDRVLHKEQLLHQAYLKVEKELQREFSAFFAACCPEVISASSACVPLPMNADEVDAAWQASQRPVNNGRRSCKSAASSPNELQAYRERTRLLREAEYRNGVTYELVLLIQSTSLEETFTKIQQAKHQSALMGHANLDVLPEIAAAPHVREMAHHFYDGASEQEKRLMQRAIAAQHERSLGGKSLGDGAAESDSVAAALVSGHMGVFVRRGEPRTINVAQSADSYFHVPTNAYTEAHAVFTEDLKVNRGQ